MPEFTLDYETDRGKVRLLIPDTDQDNFVLEDSAIDAFLSLSAGDVRLAAAEALEVIATNEALVLKVQRTIDVDTDGAKLAETLLKRAATLRKIAVEGTDGGGDFEIIEFAGDQFSARQVIWNDMLRERT